ncbi:MAG TPA: hypothetical protein VLZ83_03130 [Edaphocola sp.]|nr:hypothetical protein [Edaphocola sp.]
MENIAILGEVILKYLILLISIIGLIRLWIIRKDGKKHYLTFIITSISTFFALGIFGGGYFKNMIKMSEISGDFRLNYYQCEQCPECIVRLTKDGTYVLLKNGQEIDKGNWDYSTELYTVFLHIENGSNNEVLDDKRTLSYIKNDNCQTYWYNQNLNSGFSGKILQIDTINTHYGYYSIKVRDERTQRNLVYEPKYLGHPWLNDKIKVGDTVTKDQKSMNFSIKKADGKEILIKE